MENNIKFSRKYFIFTSVQFSMKILVSGTSHPADCSIIMSLFRRIVVLPFSGSPSSFPASLAIYKLRRDNIQKN
jgi:hypothetical protein